MKPASRSTTTTTAAIILFIAVVSSSGNGQYRRKRQFYPGLYCACPYVLAEVCGSDGATYGNQCLLDCERNRMRNYGLVTLRHGSCEGAEVYQPVAGWPVQTQTPTPPPVDNGGHYPLGCPCGRVLNEVCASNGITYGNPCEMECQNKLYRAGLFKMHDGRCRTSNTAHSIPIVPLAEQNKKIFDYFARPVVTRTSVPTM